MAGPPRTKKRGVGHWYGKKELKNRDAEGQRKRYAQYQTDLADARAKSAAIKAHPKAICSACGRPMKDQLDEKGNVVTPGHKVPCPRGHAMVMQKQPLPALIVHEAEKAKKLAEFKEEEEQLEAS